MYDLNLRRWIIAFFFIVDKLSRLNLQSYSLSAPDEGQRHEEDLVSVVCVWPAGFKIGPGKLIVSAELQQKPHGSNFYSILERRQDIKGLVSIMKQRCGLAVVTESFKDDLFLFLSMQISPCRLTLGLS